MPRYTLISGEVITYDADSELAAFLERAERAADDPEVSVSDMVEILYGEENPLLERGVIPGRGFVTAGVLADPTYRVMLDFLDRKRVQRGALDLEAAESAHNLTVADAAERLGISAGAVRQAIAARRLPAIKRNGQYWLRPEAVASYRVTRRGPAPSEARSPALRVRWGSEGTAVLHVRHDGDLVTERVGNVREGALTGWSWATLKLVRKDLDTVRVFHLRPGQTENAVEVGGLYVHGRFEIVSKINNKFAALAAWKESGR